MPEAAYEVGQAFRVQFVWRIPEGDFLRAIFRAKVLHRDLTSDKYVVELEQWLVGRQEDEHGSERSADDYARTYWQQVDALVGRKVSLAFEAQDGRPLWLRIETLTGEHDFFRRLNELPPALQARLDKLSQDQADLDTGE